MSRFRRVDNEPVYSELKPGRCGFADERERSQAIREFMEEITEPEPELQIRANVSRATLG